MILPVLYLWQQLNGPQVSGICKAIEAYWKDIFDVKLDYFNTLSIETANDQHLTLFGLLSGLVRPTISEPDKDFFYFTEYAESDFDHGFSDVNDRSVGGRFNKTDVMTIHNTSLDTEYYRALLRAWTSGEGEIGSLMLFDDICNELTKLDIGPDVTPFYQFSFMYGDDIPRDRAPGDVFIDMRSMKEWKNPLHVYATIQGIADSAYAPQPRMFVSLASCPQSLPASAVYIHKSSILNLPSTPHTSLGRHRAPH